MMQHAHFTFLQKLGIGLILSMPPSLANAQCHLIGKDHSSFFIDHFLSKAIVINFMNC